MIENPENRENFRHVPIFEISVKEEDLEGKTSIDIILEYLEERFARENPDLNIVEVEKELKSHLISELKLDKIDGDYDEKHNRVASRDFFTAFDDWTSGDIAKDVIVKNYFILRHPKRFLFRGAQTKDSLTVDQIKSNIIAFGTEYNPARYGSTSDFWAEKGKITMSGNLAKPTTNKPLSMFMIYDPTNMSTVKEPLRSPHVSYSWQIDDERPLADRVKSLFLLKIDS